MFFLRRSRFGNEAAFLFLQGGRALTFFVGHRIVKGFVPDGGWYRPARKARPSKYDPSKAVFSRPLL
jgi:hypothetical protein